MESLDDIPDDELPEMKHTVVAAPSLVLEPLSVFEKFSCFRKLQRVTAWVLRFKENSRKSKELRNYKHHVTVAELRQAELTIVRVIQNTELADEIHRIETKTPCRRIADLNPMYFDGLLRVGGRLQHSVLPTEMKHQLILPNSSSVTKLLLKTLHDIGCCDRVQLHGKSPGPASNVSA